MNATIEPSLRLIHCVDRVTSREYFILYVTRSLRTSYHKSFTYILYSAHARAVILLIGHLLNYFVAAYATQSQIDIKINVVSRDQP